MSGQYVGIDLHRRRSVIVRKKDSRTVALLPTRSLRPLR